MSPLPPEHEYFYRRADYAPWLPYGRQLEVLPAGIYWNAVRMPTELGERVLAELGDFTGAVIEDRTAGTLYWLVPPHAAKEWDFPGVEILGNDSVVGIPGPLSHFRCQWRVGIHEAGTLTEPDVLRTAILATTRANQIRTHD